jgi:hypothetical protein
MIWSQDHWEDWTCEGHKTLEMEELDAMVGKAAKHKDTKREDSFDVKEEMKKITSRELLFIQALEHGLDEESYQRMRSLCSFRRSHPLVARN